MDVPDSTEARLLAAIAAQERLRGTLDDALIDATIGALKAQLETLSAAMPAAPEPVNSGQRKLDTRRRRQVCVLFADLPVFNLLSQSLDAEELTRVLHQVWAVVDAVIEQHGGLIDKHIGPTVMALWGAEQTREDDMERALRAALEITPLLQFIPSELQADLVGLGVVEHPFRMGVHCGPVMLGAVGMNAEFTAIGDTVNTASRLQQAAFEGEILVSQEGYDLARGLFEFEARTLLKVKGKSSTLQTYRLLRKIPRRFRMQRRGVEGVSTRMVGRETELLLMQAAYRRAAENHELQAVLVCAEGGIGKSRLMDEFEGWLDTLPAPWGQGIEAARLLRARAEEGGQSLPYALLRDIFVQHCQIQESDSQAIARLKLEAKILSNLSAQQVSEAAETAALIGQLLGFDYSAAPSIKAILQDGAQLSQLAYRKIAAYFQRLAQLSSPAPLLILLDDLHWADDGSLDLLEFLGGVLEKSPVLLLTASRPSLYELHPNWLSQSPWPNLLRLDLNPLSPEASRELILQILQRLPDVPANLLNTILENAEGNPYYLEELLKMLIEQGVIVKHADGWQARMEYLRQLQVPPTLTGILQARLDQLPAEEEELLRRAAVVGRTFWESAIVAPPAGGYSPEENLKRVRVLLERLSEREFIFLQSDSLFENTREFVFKHAILRSVVYQRLLKTSRLVYHRRAAEWLIAQAGDRVEDHAGLIAEHFAQAEATDQAVEWFGRAGRLAHQAYLPRQAQAYFERAMELMGGNTQEMPALLAAISEHAFALPVLKGLVEVYQDLGCGRESLLMLEAAVQVAEARDLKSELVYLLDLLTIVQVELTEMQQAQVTLNRAMALAQEIQPSVPGLLGQIYWRQGILYNHRGLLAESDTQLRRALDLAEQAGDRALTASCFNLLGMNELSLGNLQEAARWMLASRQIWQELGHRRFDATLANNLGEVYRIGGDYETAYSYYMQAVEICRQIDYVYLEAGLQSNLGTILLHLGDPQAALDHLALADQLHPDDIYRQSETERFRAEVYLTLGDLPSAHQAALRALRFSIQSTNPERLLHSWRVLGNLAARLGFGLQIPTNLITTLPPHLVDKDLSPEDCYQISFSYCSDGSLENERIELLADCARYAEQQGQPGQAAAWRAEALQLIEKVGVPALKRLL